MTRSRKRRPSREPVVQQSDCRAQKNAVPLSREKPPFAPTENGKVILMAAAALVAAVVAVYWNSLHSPFILDDDSNIVQNYYFRNLGWHTLLDPTALWELILSARAILYLSLTLNFKLNLFFKLDGLDVFGFHLLNMVIHVLATLTLFGLVRRTLLTERLLPLFGRAVTPLAFAIALLWAVHPLQTQAVTYIIQRAESLAGFFYLASMYCLLRSAALSHDKKSRLPEFAWAAGALAMCGLGMNTKQILITLPPMALIFDTVFLAGSFSGAWRRRWYLHGPLFSLFAIAIIAGLGIKASSFGFGVKEVQWWEYLATQMHVLVHYLRLCVWPVGQCLDYNWPKVNLSRFYQDVLPWALVILGLLGGSVFALFKKKMWGFLGVWFFLILAPTSSIVPIWDMAFEHRLYLSLAAVVAAAVLGGYLAWKRFFAAISGDTMSGGAGLTGDGTWTKYRVFPIALLLAVAVALGTATVLRNQVYRSEKKMWQDTIKKSPRNPRARVNYAVFLAQEGLKSEGRVKQEFLEEAIRENLIALTIKSNYADAYANLGVCYFNIGEIDKSFASLRKAIELTPKSWQAHYNMGQYIFKSLNLAAGDKSANRMRLEEAIREMEESLRINDNAMEVHADLAIILSAMGELQLSLQLFDEARTSFLESEKHYRRVMGVYPKGWIKNNLAHVLIVMKRFPEAVPLLLEAERELPAEGNAGNLVQVCFNLGLAYEGLAEWDNALRYYQNSFRLIGQENEAVYAKLADLALRNRSYGSALRCLEAQNEALRRKNLPENLVLTAMRAWLYATVDPNAGGDPVKALSLAEQAVATTGHGIASVQNSLAAAYLNNRRFHEAATAAGKALQLATASRERAEINKAEELLKAIRGRQMYRNPGIPPQ